MSFCVIYTFRKTALDILKSCEIEDLDSNKCMMCNIGSIKKLLSIAIKIYIMSNDKIKELHIPLEMEIFDKLEAIKEYHGIHNITEIIRFLITKEHRKINKKDKS